MEYMNDSTTIEKTLMNNASKKRIPISGSIELLPLCNMKCDMCYVRLDKHEMSRKGRIRNSDEWLNIAKEMQKAGVLFLLLTGGEPLLYKDFKKVYLGLKRLGMIITVNTNGTLIDEDWVKFFSENKPRRINITLYGANEQTYSNLCHFPSGFEKTINGIKLLKSNNVDVRISCSATKYNYHDIKKIIQIGNELDIPVRVDTYMLPATRERDKPYEYESRLDPIHAAKIRVDSLKAEMGEEVFYNYIQQSLYEVDHILPSDEPMKMSCYAGKCSFAINWQGQIRPCVVLTNPYADIFEVGFVNGWNHIVSETEKVILNSSCNQCNLRTICRTCAACALYETGKYDGKPEYMCKYANETIKLLSKENTNAKNI